MPSSHSRMEEYLLTTSLEAPKVKRLPVDFIMEKKQITVKSCCLFIYGSYVHILFLPALRNAIS